MNVPNLNVFLPYIFKPKKVDSLIRLGKKNDGGYLIDPVTLYSTTKLISFGINDDFSFEMDFHSLQKSPVFAYDNSIDKIFFIKKLISGFFSPNHPIRFFKRLKNLYNYISFFKHPNVHITKNIGSKNSEKIITFNSLWANSKLTKNERVFLKIDIEGCEYILLEEVIKIQKQLSGLVIEFHDVDKFMGKIIKFIKTFDLKICHIHCNNTGGINDKNLPKVIEISFTSGSTFKNSCLLPHVLDMPNNKNFADMKLNFKKQI